MSLFSSPGFFLCWRESVVVEWESDGEKHPLPTSRRARRPTGGAGDIDVGPSHPSFPTAQRIDWASCGTADYIQRLSESPNYLSPRNVIPRIIIPVRRSGSVRARRFSHCHDPQTSKASQGHNPSFALFVFVHPSPHSSSLKFVTF